MQWQLFVAQRATIGAQWTLVFVLAYWVSCGAIVALQTAIATNNQRSEWHIVPAKRRRHIVEQVLRNQLLLFLCLLLSALVLPCWRAWWPVPFWWPCSLAAFVLLNDAVFYTAHRLLHRPDFFKRFHAMHHEVRVAFAPAALYCHWVEMCAANFAQVAVPAFLLNFPDWAIFCFAALAAIETTVAHSRFSRYHFVHHRLLKMRFGSSFGLCDRIAQSALVRGGANRINDLALRWLNYRE